jgi:ubiquinone/menaquinone biosynthesis C-methylase UbiE
MHYKTKEIASTLKHYQDHAEDLAVRYEQAEVLSLQTMLLQVFRKGSHVLELGCGSGRDAAFLRKHHLNITALDGSESMIQRAKERHPEITFLHHILPEPLPFEDRWFEGACAIAVLMHLDGDSLRQVLKELNRVLKNDAPFVFSVPLVRDDINPRGMDRKGRFFLVQSQEEWQEHLEGADFCLSGSQYTNDGLNRTSIQWLNITALAKHP